MRRVDSKRNGSPDDSGRYISDGDSSRTVSFDQEGAALDVASHRARSDLYAVVAHVHRDERDRVAFACLVLTYCLFRRYL